MGEPLEQGVDRAGENGPEFQAHLQALDLLSQALGLEFNPIIARTVLNQVWATRESDCPDWLNRMLLAAEALGMHATPVRWSAETSPAAIRQLTLCSLIVEERRLLVLFKQPGEEIFRLLNPDGVEVRRFPMDQLAAEAGDPAIWLAAAEPIAPMQGMSNSLAIATHATGHEQPGDYHPHGSPLARLWALVRSERKDVWVIAGYSVAIGLFTLVTPVVVQSFVNTVGFGTLLQPLLVLGFLLLLGLTASAALRAMQMYVIEILSRRLFVRMVADAAFRLPRVNLESMGRTYVPELVNRFFDVMTVQKAAAVLLVDGLTTVLQACVGLVLLAAYHPWLLVYAIFLILFISFVIFGLGFGGVRTKIEESVAKYEAAAWLEEIARAPILFKQGGGADYAMNRADAVARRYLTARRRSFRVLLRQIIGSLSFQVLGNVLLLSLGGWLVIDRQLTLGQLIASELILAAVLAAFSKFGKQLESYYDLVAGVDKLGYILDLPLERNAGDYLPSREGGLELELEDVSYTHASGQTVLHGISMRILPGQHVVVFGPGNSGKTTLAEILYGIRRPVHGRVKADGVEISALHLESLRKNVVLVRRGEVIHGAIADNVSLGRPGVTPQQIRDYLNAVGLLDEVQALPDGIHTGLGANGSPLSDQQVRKLSLARALAEQPRLLVLDGTLDDMDIVNRARILSAICGTEHSATLLVLTNHPDVALHFERIFVLNDGRLREYTRSDKALRQLILGKEA
ncbi:MAG: hypothetical protein GMKNLPBB_00601 [Myxococcota bacterium]|nr:hypothetical protein [Myxococcota bacterium]